MFNNTNILFIFNENINTSLISLFRKNTQINLYMYSHKNINININKIKDITILEDNSDILQKYDINVIIIDYNIKKINNILYYLNDFHFINETETFIFSNLKLDFLLNVRNIRFFNTLKYPQIIAILENNNLLEKTNICKIKHYHDSKEIEDYNYDYDYSTAIDKQNINELLTDHNTFYDMVYIINLKKNKKNKYNSEIYLKQLDFKKYKFIDAINPKDIYKYSLLYKKLSNKINKPEFCKSDFTIGALGCFLSHIQCIKDAKYNGYNKILILEDDFIPITNYVKKINELFDNIPEKWDFIYLGKKQFRINSVQKINEYIYKPNSNTFATHALLINHTVFDNFIKLENNINKPIDIALQQLYTKHVFYSVYTDLFITDDKISDVQLLDKSNMKWDWNLKLYKQIIHNKIQNIIIYGFKNNYHTHHYIHHMYYNYFKYYYSFTNVLFFDENEIDHNKTFNNSIIFCSPTHYKYNTYIYGTNNFYIFHLDNFGDNLGYNNLDTFFNDKTVTKLLKTLKNNYIILKCRKSLDLDYFQSNINTKEICLPWFSNTMISDTNKYTNNLHELYKNISNKKYYLYFGTIWIDNIEIIKNLINICIKTKTHLILKGRLFKNQLTNEDIEFIFNKHKYILYLPFDYKNNDYNSLDYIKSNYDIKCILTLQGSNKDTYFSNRTLENISNGYIISTNSPIVKKHFTTSMYDNDIEQLLYNLENVFNNKTMFINLITEQLNEYYNTFYGYNIIHDLITFVKEIAIKNNTIIDFNNYYHETKPYQFWFCSNNYTNKYYFKINNNNDLLLCFKNNYDILMDENTLNNIDIYLLISLLSNIPFDIYVDHNYKNIDKLTLLFNKYNLTFNYKNNCNIYCLLSSQRTGSTLLVDYIQKLSSDTLCLSEPFNNYDNIEIYSSSYDVKNGILQKIDFIPYKNNNINEYFKQFEDLAYYENKKFFVFKLTIDFFKSIDKFIYFKYIFNFLINKDVKFIYIERDLLECYTSKKLADIYGYTNVKYKTIPDNIYISSEFEIFRNNMSTFKEDYVNKITLYKSIHYDDFKNSDNLIQYIGKLFGNDLSNDASLYNIIVNNFDIEYFNIKQNVIK